MNKLYISSYRPNGTSDLIITNSDGEIIEHLVEAVFGNIKPKHFGWSGDALGNIEAVLYGETVAFISYDTPYDEENDEDERTLIDVVQSEELGDCFQVVETTLEEVLKKIAVSPVSDGWETVKTLKKYFKQNRKAA